MHRTNRRRPHDRSPSNGPQPPRRWPGRGLQRPVQASAGVILERIKPRPGSEAAFRDWYEADYLPQAARRAGVKSGALLVFREYGQMLPGAPEATFIAVYRLSDSSAVPGWDETVL